jgi:Tfp pilus assembly protein PilO
MGRSKASSWIAGTVVVALLMAAASWFLLLSPQLTTASETRAAAESTRSSNETLALRVERLKAQFAELDQYKADLVALRLQIPTTAELSELMRQLDGAAAAHSVTVTAVSPGTPAAVTVTAPQAPAADPAAEATESTEETDAADSGESADAAAAAAVASLVPAGMTQIPLSLTVVGSYDNVDAFIDTVQTGTSRLLLIANVSGVAQEDAVPGGGRPATSVGDVEATLTGAAFVLPDASVTAVPDPAETAPVAPPAAVPGKNPLVPVSG